MALLHIPGYWLWHPADDHPSSLTAFIVPNDYVQDIEGNGLGLASSNPLLSSTADRSAWKASQDRLMFHICFAAVQLELSTSDRDLSKPTQYSLAGIYGKQNE